MKHALLLTSVLFAAVAPMTSCREKGPAEKIGESVDKTADDIKDAVNPKGPVEKAGEKIDNALGN